MILSPTRFSLIHRIWLLFHHPCVLYLMLDAHAQFVLSNLQLRFESLNLPPVHEMHREGRIVGHPLFIKKRTAK